MAGLRLSLQYEGQYPEAVAEELRQLVAAIQSWAGGTGFGVIPEDSTVGGSHTVTLQPAFRAYLDTSASIADSTEQELVWLTPSADPTSSTEFDVTGAFDGVSKVWLSLPGVYLVRARVRWDTNTAGTSRLLQLRIYGDDTTGDLTNNAPAASLTQDVSAIVRVTQELLDRASYPRGIPVNVEAYQNSGGARTLTASSWFSVVKLF